jgi:hypothetical protein
MASPALVFGSFAMFWLSSVLVWSSFDLGAWACSGNLFSVLKDVFFILFQMMLASTCKSKLFLCYSLSTVEEIHCHYMAEKCQNVGDVLSPSVSIRNHPHWSYDDVQPHLRECIYTCGIDNFVIIGYPVSCRLCYPSLLE